MYKMSPGQFVTPKSKDAIKEIDFFEIWNSLKFEIFWSLKFQTLKFEIFHYKKKKRVGV